MWLAAVFRWIAAMPLSTRSLFEVGHIGRVKGGSASALPDLSTDFIEDDFDLNRSFPCTKRLMYTQNRTGLEHFPWLLTGEWLIWRHWVSKTYSWSVNPLQSSYRLINYQVLLFLLSCSVSLYLIMSFAMLMKDGNNRIHSYPDNKKGREGRVQGDVIVMLLATTNN